MRLFSKYIFAAGFCLLAIGGYQFIIKIPKDKELVMFWRPDCAPCLIEIGFLPEIATSYPNLKIALVALEDKQIALSHLPKALPANVAITYIDKNQEEVLRNFGDDKLSLPFSIFRRSDGSICDKNYGILGIRKINHWIKTC